MLNFDEQQFLRIQTGALGLASRLKGTVATCLREGASNIFFLGTGGAAILMQPAAQLLAHRSTFAVHTDLSAELVLGGSPHLGPGSIVVIPSLSGTTAESLTALAACKAKGATVLVLTGHADSRLALEADQAFVNFAEDDTSSESFYLQSLLLVLALMGERGELEDSDAIVAELRGLPTILLALKRTFEAEAEAEGIAHALAAKPAPIIVGAGSTWPQASYYGMCVLEEMQWIRTRPVHASDFFHGTLELVEKGTNLLILQGEDAYRPLTERVATFARRLTDDVVVLDTGRFALPGLSPRVRALIAPVLLATALERVSAHLEVLRDHPLTTRRYYKRIAY